MSHIEKRGPGRWRARYCDPAGHELSRTFATKRASDVRRWYATMTRDSHSPGS